MNLMSIFIVLFIACGIASIILYFLAFTSIKKIKAGNTNKINGIILIFLGTILAYIPLRFIFGLQVLSIGIFILVLIDFIIIL